MDTWFQELYKELDGRYPSMKMALELMQDNVGDRDATIVETGCMRLANDWGAGQSTLVFCDYLNRYGGNLTSVDINMNNVKFCEKATEQYAHLRTMVCEDSVKYLENHPKDNKIDLLYLDSWDYPYFELLDIYGDRHKPASALEKLALMTDDQIAEKHANLILPSQNHCVKELDAGLPLLSEKAVLLIDDNTFPGGGKPRLAKKKLEELGWKMLFDSQQTLWAKS
jgi:hypothetical protein